MRDIFEDIYKHNPLDPMESARQGARPTLRKRFYQSAGVKEEGGAFHVLLDGKAVRTPARKPLAAPTRALAEALASEWQAQTDVIDPARMPLTRLANSIVDGVAGQEPAVAGDILKYLGSDLLFYRADGPESLIERQTKTWDPLIAWARDALGARFILAQGIVHVAQPDEAIAAARKVMPADAWRLGAMHSVTTLTGSALLALALSANAATPDAVWDAAHVDEDHNMQTWGRDEQAMARRDVRAKEFDAAVRILQLLPRVA
jgi:chaperone required for assembly of F1-ATPase